jgi:uncharacterized protein YndB with AHSA1/START domain
MALIDSTVQINVPVEKVYAFLTNLENQKHLGAGVTEVVVNGPIAVGTRYTIKGQAYGRAYSTENEIVALEPNKRFGIKTLAPPPASPVTNTYTLAPEGSGTKLTLTMDAVIFPGTEGMVKPQLVKALDTGNATLKKLLEG